MYIKSKLDEQQLFIRTQHWCRFIYDDNSNINANCMS